MRNELLNLETDQIIIKQKSKQNLQFLMQKLLKDIDLISSKQDRTYSDFSNSDWTNLLEWAFKLDEETTYFNIYMDLSKSFRKIKRRLSQYEESHTIPDDILYYQKIEFIESIFHEMLEISENSKKYEAKLGRLQEKIYQETNNTVLLREQYQFLLQYIYDNRSVQSSKLEKISMQHLKISRATYFNYMKELTEQDLIKSQKVGKNSFYSITRQGNDACRYLVGKKISSKYGKSLQERLIQPNDLLIGGEIVNGELEAIFS